ncbi:MAG: hypothetical protein VKL20_05990 [Synechocystis sp.]|nr:hypothetical protein [Synechocystis sp.]
MGLVGMLLTLVTLSGVKRIRHWFLIWSGRKQEAQQLELEELAELESEEGD